jgi:uncharacterized glyoxalase superfamily protein PhnB
MTERIVPMIHVPDVGSTIDWYLSIGFAVRRTGEEDGVLVWASLVYGESEIMLSCGGKASSAPRREFDLYIHMDRVDQLHEQFKGRVDVVEDLHDTFYGMREFIIRDNNGFWITFGQPV